MMASLSPEQREQLAQLMSQVMTDPDLASQMAQLADNLRALRPGMERGPVQSGGGEALGYSAAVEAVAELARLQAPESPLGGGSARCPPGAGDGQSGERRVGECRFRGAADSLKQ